MDGIGNEIEILHLHRPRCAAASFIHVCPGGEDAERGASSAAREIGPWAGKIQTARVVPEFVSGGSLEVRSRFLTISRAL